MSLDTLLEAVKYLESSTKATSKALSASARVPCLSNAQTQRNRTISESSEGERRRRPGGAGTRETHNKLEKNRRAHLKECFDILKSEVPNLEDKKTSNLNILRSAFKYIQTLKKHERQLEVERDSLKIGNTLLREKLRALKKDLQPEVEGDKSHESEDLSKNGASERPVPPSITALASVGKDGQVLPVSVATQTTFSPVKSEAPNSLEDSSNVSCHSDSTESTQEDEDVDIDGSDDGDEKDVEVNVVDEVEEKQHNISEVNRKKKEKEKKEKEKRVEEKRVSSVSKDGQQDFPLARNGTLQKSLSRSSRRSSFDVENGGETSQDEFDMESFRPKIQSCARVSC